MTRFNHIGPHFYTSDVGRSREFYEAVLGFTLDYVDGQPAHYVVMCRDDVCIHLSRPGPFGLPQHPGAAFVAVAGVDLLWSQVAHHEDAVLAPLAEVDYGTDVRFRAFAVRDPDNNVLRIGEPLPTPLAT